MSATNDGLKDSAIIWTGGARELSGEDVVYKIELIG